MNALFYLKFFNTTMNLHFKSESLEGWSVCLVVSCLRGFKGSEKSLEEDDFFIGERG